MQNKPPTQGQSFFTAHFSGQNRNFGLDVLRAFAIWFVLYAHALVYLKHIIPLKYARHFMFDGVGVFFVLSGFLIGTIFIKKLNKPGGKSWRSLLQFWLRRWLRTLPNYYLVLTGLVIFYTAFRDLSGVPVYKYYFFAQNLFTPHPPFFNEAWSLSVEEWFYLTFPLLAFVCVKLLRFQPKTALVLVAFAIIAVSVYARYHWVVAAAELNLQTYGINIRQRIITRLDGLMIGVLLAWISVYARHVFARYAKLFLLLGLGLLAFYLSVRLRVDVPVFAVLNNTTFSVAVALLIPALVTLKTKRKNVVSAVTFVSITSYSAYIINLSVQDILLYNMLKWVDLPETHQGMALLKLVLFFGITLLGAFLLYRYFEHPIMQLRDKWISPKK